MGKGGSTQGIRPRQTRRHEEHSLGSRCINQVTFSTDLFEFQIAMRASGGCIEQPWKGALKMAKPSAASFRPLRWLPAGKLLSAAVLDQAVLSAVNLLVGVLLLRNADQDQYALFVLAQAGVLLATAVYQSLIGRPMSIQSQDLPEGPERQAYTQTMFGAQALITLPLTLLAAIGMWLCAGMSHEHAPGFELASVIAAIAAALTVAREHLRQSLMLLRKPQLALKFDLLYAVMFAGIVFAAVDQPYAAAWALTGMAAGSLMALILARKHLIKRTRMKWQLICQAFAKSWPLGRWSLAGGLLAWSYLNGFYYVVSLIATLNTVAILGAARLLVMPINLLITGMNQQMLPMTRNWLNLHGIRGAEKRLAIASLGVCGLALTYLGLLWLLRSPIIVGLLGQSLTELEPIVLLWGATYVAFTVRSTWMLLLQALGKFDSLTRLVAIAAPISLVSVFVLVPKYGAAGAVTAVLIAELIELTGIGWLLLKYRRLSVEDQPSTHANQ